MIRSRMALAALALAAAAGCAHEPTPEQLAAQLAEAERLCLDGQFEQAKTLLKQYLVHRPTDAGAHYYLGRTFMLSQDLRPVMAEGEFQTALRLFIAQGRQSPIERFSADYFELICNIDSAKVLYIQGSTVAGLGQPPQVIQPILARALEYVERARAVNPNAAEVEQIGAPIRELAAQLRAFSAD